MTDKTINDIVWWIPIKSLRNNIREVLYSIKDIHEIVRKNIPI